MRKYKRILLLHTIISILTSVLVIFVYENIAVKNDKDLYDNILNAKNVALTDWKLSEGYRRLFTASTPDDFTNAAEKAIKAVVGVKNLEENADEYRPFDAENSGSGVIINGQGYIVTNHHLVGDAKKVEVIFHDDRSVMAVVKGIDKSTDLALLKVDVETQHFIDFGNSDSLRIGEWILAVGNPFGLRSSVTAGIVSAKARNINLLEESGIESFIQTDAVVNPGNSGGAMVNTNGELIGICTAILSQSGKYEGYSFAIPSNIASKVVSDLIQFGSVQRGWLGVEIENIAPNLKAEGPDTGNPGVVISSVFKNGAGYDAGLQKSDVIHTINNVSVSSVSVFMEQISKYSPGDKIQIKYRRSGRDHVTIATLRNQLNTTELLVSGKEGVFKSLGFEVRDMVFYEKTVFSLEGVIVVSIQNGTPVSMANMEPGYVITHVNSQRIDRVSELSKILKENGGRDVQVDGFYPKFPGKYTYKLSIPVD